MGDKLKFNFQRGSATKKGKILSIRVITKDHFMYSKYFDENGERIKSKEEIEADKKKAEKLKKKFLENIEEVNE